MPHAAHQVLGNATEELPRLHVHCNASPGEARRGGSVTGRGRRERGLTLSASSRAKRTKQNLRFPEDPRFQDVSSKPLHRAPGG